ncbi:hypothetical protein TOPH_04443 [Tolypocladium ophioglossoides CBS 100239]|uniref:Uncharacterized protein n=1 Tax=Tolypocladium ophioglossoides (strain CBS 100239) TaxID=1163406 RepID=A0A0L0N9H4_TOLOC|nr:hypothetical protein TOPH_04443 [Tolypocladium ophioglossoides CBS 100239]
MASTQVDAAALGNRPGFYVHVEFGMSWTARHKPRARHLSYVSRGMRRRASQFPRHVPPSNTNFLTYQQCPYDYDHGYHNGSNYYYTHGRHNHQDSNPPGTRHHQPQADHQLPHHHQHQHQHLPQQQTAQHGPSEARPRPRSRSRSSTNRPSRSRGISAPPPFNDSPWDADPEPMTATALPRRKPLPQLFKALPATPAQFRLGEEGMPWSSLAFPMGYGDGDDASATRDSPHEFALGLDDRERGRAREMESLAAAMMTVDNGFEDQWWLGCG